MDERLQAELDFWIKDYGKYKGQDYTKIRASNLARIAQHWPQVNTLVGDGLDLGCGPTSIFEHSCLTGRGTVYAVDPLLPQYTQQVYWSEDATVTYVVPYSDGGALPFSNDFFDYVFCINVIDHTEYFHKLLDEVMRTLRDGGSFFLQVNFDTELTPPAHTKLWDWHDVQCNMRLCGKSVSGSTTFGPLKYSFIHGFKPLVQTVEWSQENQRYEYWGTFRKE